MEVAGDSGGGLMENQRGRGMLFLSGEVLFLGGRIESRDKS